MRNIVENITTNRLSVKNIVRISAVAFGLIIIVLLASGKIPLFTNTSAATFPGNSWEWRNPSEVGLDETKLNQFVSLIGGDGVVIKNGYIVKTWGNPDAQFDWASAVKPVFSTLLFAAIDEGKINNVDSIVTGWSFQGKDQGIRWRHLADMTSGYARGEGPGEAWAYNDVAINLYAKSLFDKVYNKSPNAVLNEQLGALQFEHGDFFGSRGGFGAETSPKDFARIGWLWANKGYWKGQQLIPKSFFDTYMKADVANSLPRTSKSGSDYLNIGSLGGDTDQTSDGPGYYGFNWWFNKPRDGGPLMWPDAPADTFQANGHWGREVMTVIPSLNIVVAARGTWGGFAPGDKNSSSNQRLKLLAEAVLDEPIPTQTPTPAPTQTAAPTPTPTPPTTGTSLPGQIVVDPNNRSWLYYNKDSNNDGKLDPFYWAGAGGPEGFLFLSTSAQNSIINALSSGGANALYMHMVRSHGGDGGSNDNPFKNKDPNQGADQAVLNEWNNVLAKLEQNGIYVLLFFYDDSSIPYSKTTFGSTEKQFIRDVVNTFENRKNIIWAIAEEYEEGLSTSKVSAMAAEIRNADNYNHPIAVHHLAGNVMDFPNDPNIDQFAQQAGSTSAGGLYNDVAQAFSNSNGRYNVNMAENFNSTGGSNHATSIGNGDRTDVRRRNWAAGMAGGYVMAVGAWENNIGGTPSSGMITDWGRQIRFFESTDFDQMLPSTSLRDGGTQYLLANQGKSYIAYASNLSGDIGVRNMISGTYSLKWLDLNTGSEKTETKSVGSGTQYFSRPSGIGNELAVYIQKTSNTAPTSTPQPTATATPTPVPTDSPGVCTGDINNDSTINSFDRNILLSNIFVQISGPNSTESDLNSDAVVDILDYALLNRNYGKICE